MNKSENLCKTIILCGGRGTRLGKIGKKIPKPLVKLHEKPILYHKLSHSINQGFCDFIIAVGYKGHMIVNACKKMDLNFHVDFSDSGEDAGMLRRIHDAGKLFKDRAIVTYGDSLSNIPLKDLMDFHLKKKESTIKTITKKPAREPIVLRSFLTAL